MKYLPLYVEPVCYSTLGGNLLLQIKYLSTNDLSWVLRVLHIHTAVLNLCSFDCYVTKNIKICSINVIKGVICDGMRARGCQHQSFG